MSRLRTVHRVTAEFPTGWTSGKTYTRTWHYLTKRAAIAREKRCRTGWSVERGPEDGYTVPPAVSVIREESAPIVWPDRPTPTPSPKEPS